MTNTTNHPAGNYATINGISLYYEVHGNGKPLIMLHGSFGSFEMFSALSPALAISHKVIGVDLYGHGRTALTSRVPQASTTVAHSISGAKSVYGASRTLETPAF